MKFNLYSIWSDPMFYAAATVFALGMFFLIFSIRKYLEMNNKCDFEEPGEESGEMEQGELPLEAETAEAAGQLESGTAGKTEGEIAGKLESVNAGQPETSAFPPSRLTASQPSGLPAEHPSSSKAEEFVKGLYQNLASMDGRLKNIEAVFSKANVNKDFTVTFLEDMISDFDALDKEKIKARIEYLVSDLKK